jgi:integrase
VGEDEVVMTRGHHLLTAIAVRNAAKPDTKRRRVSDGGGLYLVVEPSGSASWSLNIQVNGRRRDIGLGGLRDVSLSRARELATEARSKLKSGIDVVTERKATRYADKSALTFEQAALRVHAENASTWRNAKHRDQWINTLRSYAFSVFGTLPIDQVTGPHVRDALSRIWLEKPETARRVRQRIGTVIGWAVSKGLRSYPIDLKAVTDGLPRRRQRVEHHRAMPYDDIPVFITQLRSMVSVSPAVRLGLEMVIITAARSGEVRGARWNEIDLETKLWVIPGSRMKAGDTHTVPLSGRAIEILVEMSKLRRDEGRDDVLVFEGSRRGRPISDMALGMLMRRNELPFTVHGFRSAFADWVGECTVFGRDLADLSLSHKVGSRVSRAYARSDLLERRRELMAAWDEFCCPDTGKVISLATRR